MKKTRIFIIIINLLLFFNILFAQKEYEYYYEEKDPFVAGLLSATMMGLGQFYTKEYTKGSIFVLTDFIQKGTLIWMIIALNEKYTDEDKGDQVVEWQEISDTDKSLIIGYLIFYFGSKIYCIIDAVHSANVYNKNIEKQRESFNTSFNLNFEIENKNISVGYFRRF